MLTMDIFNDNAFSAVEMTAAVDRIGYKPNFLSGMPGLYTPKPVRTSTVFIEERDSAPALIMTSERGTPPKEKGGDKRKVKAFQSARIAIGSTIFSEEIQGVRAFGSDTALKTAQEEVARRQVLLRADIDLTLEFYLLGLIQGLFLDADGSTIIDWAAELGQTKMAEVDFDLDAASPAPGVLRKKSNSIVREVAKRLKGLGGMGWTLHALCGHRFYDDFVTHKEVRETYLNYQAAQELRNNQGNPYQSFTFAGITYHDYRGTDDDKTVMIDPDKAYLFPVGAGIFQMAYSPAEGFDFANTLGRPLYSWMIRDRDRNAWVRPELACYPLPVCVQPSALGTLRRT